jgi:hypothetical protein
MGQDLNGYSNEFAGVSDLDPSACISLNSSSDVTPCDSTSSIVPSNMVQNMDATSRMHLWADYVECGCLTPHVQASAAAGLSEYRDLKVLNVDLSPFPVDPFDNTLRVERICICDAVTANRLHMGITEDMLCHDDAISPFFRPFSNSIGDSKADDIVRTIQTIFKSLKPDLRPIKEQIMIRHHPIIDLHHSLCRTNSPSSPPRYTQYFCKNQVLPSQLLPSHDVLGKVLFVEESPSFLPTPPQQTSPLIKS